MRFQRVAQQGEINLEESGLALVEDGMEDEARRQLSDDGVFFKNVTSNEVDGFFLFAQFHLMTLGLSLCSTFSLLNVMFRNELFPHGLLLLDLLRSISQCFGRARPLIHSYKSQLYPMPHKQFGGKSHWLYHQNVFRMRMFSSSSTENSLAQDIFVLHLNNFNISLSSLSAQSYPFPQTSSQQQAK